jgi:HrpA-like RNA helicase
MENKFSYNPQNREREDFGNDQKSVEAEDRAEMEFAQSGKLSEIKRKILEQKLPVAERLGQLKDSIRSALADNSMLLFQGEPGSGKSVFGPPALREILLEQGLPERIVVMQPRRDVAKATAEAVAAVSDEELGKGVGFLTSEFRQVDSQTHTTMMTPGIFLRRLREGKLSKSSAGGLIIDEVHEGSIDYHITLGLLKMAKARGDAPFVMLTSATLDRERIQNFLSIEDNHYICIEGRSYPVDKKYFEEKIEENRDDSGRKLSYIDKAVSMTLEAVEKVPQGDILVFMPGDREITETIQQLGAISDTEIVSLQGYMGPNEREYVLLGNNKPPHIKRRIIVATPIAETSLTIPGITVVIDSCRKRSVRYNPDTGIIEKGTELISKDEAEQRAGRAGRLGPGKAFRAVTETEYKNLRDHAESEISRTNLAHMYLQVKGMDLDPENFPFIEPPQEGSLRAAKIELQGLGAIDEQGNITELGKEIAELPFEPRIGRLVIEARRKNMADVGLVLAAFSREQNITLPPTKTDIENMYGSSLAEKKVNARNKITSLQSRFSEGGSDWLKNLNIFKEAIAQGAFEASRNYKGTTSKLSHSRFGDWCKQYYINPSAITHIAYKLGEYARYADIRLDRSALPLNLSLASRDSIDMVILSAFADKIIYQQESWEGRFPIFGSVSDLSGEDYFISPGSEAFNSGLHLGVAPVVTEGKAKQGYGQTKKYAANIHPVTWEKIKAVVPSMIVEEPLEYSYNNVRGGLYQEVAIKLKTASGGTVLVGSENRVRENLTPEESLFLQNLEKAKISLEDLERRIRSIRSEQESVGFGFRLELSFSDLQKIRELIYPSYSYVRKTSMPDPEKALSLVEKTIHELNIQEEALRNFKEKKQEAVQLLASVEDLYSQMFADRSYKLYGLTAESHRSLYRNLELGRRYLGVEKPRVDIEDSDQFIFRPIPYVIIEPKKAIELLRVFESELMELKKGSGLIDKKDLKSVDQRRLMVNEACNAEWNETNTQLLDEDAGLLEAMVVESLSKLIPKFGFGSEFAEQTKDKLKKAKGDLREIKEILSKKNVRPITVLGKINTLRRSYEQLVKSWASRTLPQSNPEYFSITEKFWFEASSLLSQNTDAQEFISAGLVSEQEMLKKLRAYVLSELPDMIQGKPLHLDMNKAIEDLLTE